MQLKALTRSEQAKKNKKIRSQDEIPAVMYGAGLKNKNLKVLKKDFEKLYQIAGESSLFDLIIDNQPPVKVLIQDIQKDNISDKVLHIDFYQVDMNKKLTTEIKLLFSGIAPAVKELNGVLMKNHDTIKVKCLPKDLVKELNIDVSSLKTFSDYIYAKDLKLSSGLELLTEANAIIAQVTPPRSDEELKSLESEVKEEVDKVSAVEKKEVKEDEAAEEAKPASKKEDKK